MSCSRLRKHATEPDLEGHAGSCPSCREWVARQRRARAATARLAHALTLEAAEPAPAVEAALRQAFRDHSSRQRAAGRLAPALGGPAWVLGVTVAGAAAAVVIVVAGVHRPHPSLSPAAASIGWQPAAVPSPCVGPSGAARAVAAVRQSTRPRAAARLLRAERPVAVIDAARPTSEPNAADALAALPGVGVDPAAATRPGVATENTPELADTGAFIPLLADLEPSAIESGQIVRVQLTEEEIRAAKLPAPIGSAGATGRIEAEVLLGPDGVARGIRPARPGR